MGKNKQSGGAKYTTTAAIIWAKFEEADKKKQYFEYECWHPDFGLCVRNTVLDYCQIITKEEALKWEADSEEFFAIVDAKTSKEFSPHYWYYMDVTDEEDPVYYAVRKKETV